MDFKQLEPNMVNAVETLLRRGPQSIDESREARKPEGNVEIYLDANATTAVSAAVRAALLAALNGPQNPSSAHTAGARAREIIEKAREEIAQALGGAEFENLLFTSGGTEANNIVIRGFASLPHARILYSAVEHASVARPAALSGGTHIPVDPKGILALDAAEAAVATMPEGAPVLACVQAANSETGIIQPIVQIADRLKMVHDNVYLLVDAAQAFGRITFDHEAADAISFSGHKLHAPTGTGFLYLSDRLTEILPAFIFGGGQERGLRPGTQNVSGAAALAAAVNERMSDLDAAAARLSMLRDRLEQGIVSVIPGATVVGASSPRVPNTLNICFPGQDAQSLMARLDAEGVMCSTGSACSSARPEASPVLKAMGMSEKEASRCLRFSVSVVNTEEEMDKAVRIIARCAAKGTAA